MQLIPNVKKLESVLATFTLVTGASEEVLIRILCIHYSIQFQKDKSTI